MNRHSYWASGARRQPFPPSSNVNSRDRSDSGACAGV